MEAAASLAVFGDAAASWLGGGCGAALEAGATVSAVAKQFGTSRQTIMRVRHGAPCSATIMVSDCRKRTQRQIEEMSDIFIRLTGEEVDEADLCFDGSYRPPKRDGGPGADSLAFPDRLTETETPAGAVWQRSLLDVCFSIRFGHERDETPWTA